MARQIIDTTTNNGTYIGDPAKTAFEKTNANFLELYNFQATYFPNTGGTIGGNVAINGALSATGAVQFSSTLTTSGTVNVTNAALARLQATTASINMSISAVSAVNEGTFGTLTNHPIGVYLNSIRRGGWDTGGNFTATSLNPTSTSDVKDYIEGYTENASELLDRLVVITYKYRPEFIDSDDYVIGLLQENIKSVVPGASTDSKWVKDDVDGEEVDRLIPGNYDIAQIMALNVRAHQEKNLRIKYLEDKLDDLAQRLDRAGI